MISLSKALSVPALLVPLVATQATNLNPGGVGCVDPSGYTSCYTTSGYNFGTCAEFCTKSYVAGTTEYENCAAACQAVNWATNIGCWMQSCWNKVLRHHLPTNLLLIQSRFTLAVTKELRFSIFMELIFSKLDLPYQFHTILLQKECLQRAVCSLHPPQPFLAD
jgi:hypothetical protein